MASDGYSKDKPQNFPPPPGVHQGQVLGPSTQLHPSAGVYYQGQTVTLSQSLPRPPAPPPSVYPPGQGYPQPPPYGTPPYGPPGQELPPHYGSPQPVSDQPLPQGDNSIVAWMPMPQAPPPDCPPGLEYLALIDQILVHQKIELLEVLTGWETKNKFHVRNSLGQDVYYAVEDSDCCARQCIGPARPFDMKIFDNYKNEVIHLNRPMACQSCCFPCCLQSVEVTAPPGTVIGTVQQEWSIFYPTFAIKNASGDTVLRVEGPFWTMSCCCKDVEFRVTNADGSADVGKITKQWSGFIREAYTDADNFGISFPMDLDVKMKAVMLGACFLIDAMYFERAGSN